MRSFRAAFSHLTRLQRCMGADHGGGGNCCRPPRSPIDMVIAATAAANNYVVITANERHFRGVVEILNPSRLGG